MAKFVDTRPQELLEAFQKLDADTNQMLSEMVVAGAEVVRNNMLINMSPKFRNALTSQNVTISKVYVTPSDGGINCQAKIVGYFTNRYGKKTPAPLVANMLEYGSKDRNYHKAPFLRMSFNRKQLEAAMLAVQKKYIEGE